MHCFRSEESANMAFIYISLSSGSVPSEERKRNEMNVVTFFFVLRYVQPK